jgi:hypothetical protein
MRLSLLFVVALAGSVTACAAGPEDAETSENRLSSAEDALVGVYKTSTPTRGGLTELRLLASGTYFAFTAFVPTELRTGTESVDAQFGVCLKPPCSIGQMGGWAASTEEGKTKLELFPNGNTPLAFTVTRADGKLILLGADDVTQTLDVASF